MSTSKAGRVCSFCSKAIFDVGKPAKDGTWICFDSVGCWDRHLHARGGCDDDCYVCDEGSEAPNDPAAQIR